LANDRLLQLKL